LRVQASALYYHFADKQELLDGMAAAVVGPMPSPDAPFPGPEGWRELLRAIGQGMRTAMLSRRDGVRLILSARPAASQREFLDRLVSFLVGAGFTPHEGAVAFFTISNYVQGCALEAQQEDRWREAKDPHPDLDAYPTLRDAGLSPFDDELFAAGLDLILDALQMTLQTRNLERNRS
jgi:TetR/AcrR family tetracycline transcriptional repressor